MSAPSRLFIELYADEDVSILAADMLKARGFSVTTTRDAGQLAYAVEHGKTFLTHNRTDFEVLARHYFATGQMHSGIIIAVRRPPRELVRRLLTVLNRITADEMLNQLHYV